MSGEPSPAASILAGRIGRPHGLDGSFYVTQPRTQLLDARRELVLDGRREQIVRRAGTDARPILRLAGCSDRTTVEAWRGRDLYVPREEAPPLEEEEWWPEELEGCEVHDAERHVGVVRQLLGLPSCDVLEVEREGGGDLLVPLIRDAVRSVDVAARRIDIDLAFLGEAG
jgi:16S rRNA processing protein RimM